MRRAARGDGTDRSTRECVTCKERRTLQAVSRPSSSKYAVVLEATLAKSQPMTRFAKCN